MAGTREFHPFLLGIWGPFALIRPSFALTQQLLRNREKRSVRQKRSARGAKAALAGQTGKKRKAGPMDMEDTFILGDINC